MTYTKRMLAVWGATIAMAAGIGTYYAYQRWQEDKQDYNKSYSTSRPKPEKQFGLESLTK